MVGAVVGFPAYPTCHPATAAWDYAQLQRLGASDEVAWQLGVVPYHDGTPDCQKREWSTALTSIRGHGDEWI